MDLNLTLDLQSATFGNKLTLNSDKPLDRYIKWAVEDGFNGRSEDRDIGETIYGFFSPQTPVTVILSTRHGIEDKVVNVPIRKGGPTDEG